MVVLTVWMVCVWWCRVQDVEKEMADLQKRQKELTDAWELERKGVTYIQVSQSVSRCIMCCPD